MKGYAVASPLGPYACRGAYAVTEQGCIAIDRIEMAIFVSTHSRSASAEQISFDFFRCLLRASLFLFDFFLFFPLILVLKYGYGSSAWALVLLSDGSMNLMCDVRTSICQ